MGTSLVSRINIFKGALVLCLALSTLGCKIDLNDNDELGLVATSSKVKSFFGSS